VPEMHPNATVPVGFVLCDVELPDAPPGSVAAGLIGPGFRGSASLTTLDTSPETGRRNPT